MAFYDYNCPTCGLYKDISHPMSEIDNGLSESTLAQVTCNGTECLSDAKNIGCVFKRGITAPMIKTKSLTQSEIKAERKNRNTKVYQKEVLPYLPKAEQIHQAVSKGVKPL